MADTWYYAKGTTRQGPVTLEQLRALIASNQVLMSDNVWREGMANWAPAYTVPELAHAPSSGPPPIAPAAPGMPPPPSSYAAPHAPVIPLSQRPETWDQSQKMMRIMLIVAAGIAWVTFFTPQFYRLLPSGVNEFARTYNVHIDTWAGYSHMVWGWSTWFGITVFILSIFALAAALADFFLHNIPLVSAIMQWVHLGLFGVMGILMLLGTILGIFGIGTSGGYAYCIPITAILAVLGLALGATIAVMIVTKQRIPFPPGLSPGHV